MVLAFLSENLALENSSRMTQRILLSPCLMEKITSFQPGEYKDLQVFKPLDSIYNGIERGNLKTMGFSQSNIRFNLATNGVPKQCGMSRGGIQGYLRRNLHIKAKNLFSTWYATYGTSRINKFFAMSGNRQGILIVDAIAFGRMDVIQQLHLRHDFKQSSIPFIDLAAICNQQKVLQFFIENHYEGCTIFTMNDAALNGHLEIVKYLHEVSSAGCSYRAIDMAAKRGHLNVVEFLLDHRMEGFSFDAIREAAACGHMEILQLLVNESGEDDCLVQALCIAAENGQLEVVKFCLQSGVKCVKEAYSRACRKEQLTVKQFLRRNQCQCCEWDIVLPLERKIAHPRKTRKIRESAQIKC